MRIETRKVYVCEHCGRLCKTAGACGNHERNCKKNPSNIVLCFSCKNYKQTFGNKPIETEHGEIDRMSCKVLDKFLLSPNYLRGKWVSVDDMQGCNGEEVVLCPTVAQGCCHYKEEKK